MKDAVKGKPFITISSEEKPKGTGMTAKMILLGRLNKAREDIFYIMWKD